MKRKTFPKLMIIISLIVALAVVVPVLSGCLPGKAPAPAAPAPAAPAAEAPPVEEAPKEVHIGFLMALSGPDAGWGLPGLTGVTMWVDNINARGGLLVGGERYKVILHSYDDEAIGSKALQGARELVFNYDIKFVNTIGGAATDATADFFQEHGVIYAPLAGSDIRPDRTLLMAGIDIFPRGDMVRPAIIRELRPDYQTVAMVVQDDPLGQVGMAFEGSSYKAEGFDIVYQQLYPLETTDFAPVVSAALATNPDVLSGVVSYPTFDAMIIEQAFLQGFEGVYTTNFVDYPATLARTSPEWMEARIMLDSYPRLDDPWFEENHPPEFYTGIWSPTTFTEEWEARYGPGGPEDVGREMTGIDWDHSGATEVWGYGVELANSFDPDEIWDALRANQPIPTITGPGYWWGKEVFGLDSLLNAPFFFNRTIDGVRTVFYEVEDFDAWWQERKDAILPLLEEEGMMYWQRE